MEIKLKPKIVEIKEVVVQEERYILELSKDELQMIYALMNEVCGTRYTYKMWCEIHKLLPGKNPYQVINFDSRKIPNLDFVKE